MVFTLRPPLLMPNVGIVAATIRYRFQVYQQR